jgi:hypothetical protein
VKEIKIICYDTGKAKLTSSDSHISQENKASKIVVDFSETMYNDCEKWCDVVLANGTSLRYELGTDAEVEFNITNALTIPGALIITPFITKIDGTKVKYVPNVEIAIIKQIESGDEEAVERDDYIFELKERLDVLEGTIENLLAEI